MRLFSLCCCWCVTSVWTQRELYKSIIALLCMCVCVCWCFTIWIFFFMCQLCFVICKCRIPSLTSIHQWKVWMNPNMGFGVFWLEKLKPFLMRIPNPNILKRLKGKGLPCLQLHPQWARWAFQYCICMSQKKKKKQSRRKMVQNGEKILGLFLTVISYST